MKNLGFLIFLFPLFSYTQEYVDLLKFGYGQTLKNNFNGTDYHTNVKFLDFGFTLPVIINENQVLISGADFSMNDIQLYPESKNTGLYSTNLKIGLASTWTEKLSSTLVLLPKIASDYHNITSSDFYWGGFVLAKLKKNKHLIYRFGIYGSQEAYGLFLTPIIGWYYMSPNHQFEMDMSLPIAADISYRLKKFTLGLDYYGIGRSYSLNSDTDQDRYVDLSSLEFSGYLQLDTFQGNVLLRAKIGYSTNDYEVYKKGDNIDLGISAFSFGDNRTQLNPDISGGVFIKFEAIYRFYIK